MSEVKYIIFELDDNRRINMFRYNNVNKNIVIDWMNDIHIAMIFIKTKDDESYKCIDDKLDGYDETTIKEMDILRKTLTEQTRMK